MELQGSGTPLRTEQINDLENRLAIVFPQEYRDFLSKYNGGRPIPNVFQILRDGKPFGVKVDKFLGVYSGDVDNLIWYARIYQGRTPANIFPIAHDPGGNLICLSIFGDDIGQVYYWDHDEEAEEDEQADYRNLYFMAPSLELFLQGLQIF